MAGPNDAPILLFGESYHHPDILWATRFLVPDPVVVVIDDHATTLWTSRLEYGRACVEARHCDVRCTSEIGGDTLMGEAGSEDAMWAYLVERVCREHAATTVRVSADFPALLAQHLQSANIIVLPTLDLFVEQRRAKTDEEIAAIEDVEMAGVHAVEAAIAAIDQCEIRDGLLHWEGAALSGSKLSAIVEHHLLDDGCATFDSITCGGPESANPHATSSDVIRADLPIVLDIYPFSKATRYWGDLTRTVVRGNPSPDLMRMWEAVREAQQAGLDAVRPGANGRDVHYACCEVFASHGYGSLPPLFAGIDSSARFIHGTGHGLGLSVHEFPRIGDVDVTLRAGDVITVEPGLYDPAIGGIRIEDLVVVTADGHRNLTPLPKEFRRPVDAVTAP